MGSFEVDSMGVHAEYAQDRPIPQDNLLTMLGQS